MSQLLFYRQWCSYVASALSVQERFANMKGSSCSCMSVVSPPPSCCCKVHKKQQDFMTSFFDGLMLHTCCTAAFRKLTSTYECCQWVKTLYSCQITDTQPTGYYMYHQVVTITKILRSAHTVYLCVLCGSENKQRLFHCTALTDWFL
jgi:hypothetical protein